MLIFIFIGIVDYINIIGKYRIISYPIIASILIIAILNFIKYKMLSLNNKREINIIDKIYVYILIISLCIIIDVVFIKIKKDIIFYIIPIIVIIIMIIMLLNRIKKINQVNQVDIQENNYTLNELYKKKEINKLPIILDDLEIVDSKDDLLGLSRFIDNIYNYLLTNSPKESFSIGLISRWGTGKSSVINLLEKKDDGKNLKIVRFKPWMYENNNNMFTELYKAINNEMSNDNCLDMSKIFNEYKKLIFGNIEKQTMFNFNFLETEKYDTIEKIKSYINNKISNSYKKIVIVIDDLDRIEKKDILFVFKIIHNILNFNNIIYILCYDEDKINRMLSKEIDIDKKFMEKIIQEKIYIPIINSNKIYDILSNCLKNLLSFNDINIKNRKNFNDIIKKLSKSFKNIREIIIYLNSVSREIEMIKRLNLFVPDFLILNYFKTYDYPFYEKIYKNKIKIVNPEMYLQGNMFREHYTNKVEFYKQASIKENYIELLGLIFPYLEDNEEVDKENVLLNHRCCDELFFDSYFYLDNDSYNNIEIKVNKYIDKVNAGIYKKDTFKSLVLKVPEEKRYYIFKIISLRIKEIQDKKQMILTILKHLDILYDLTETSSCIYEVMYECLISLGKKQKDLIKETKKQSRKILVKLMYYTETKVSTSTNAQNSKLLKNIKDEIEQDINYFVDNRINIFDDIEKKYYNKEFVKRILNDKYKLQEYFLDITNEKNIFRMAFLFLNHKNKEYSVNSYEVGEYYESYRYFKQIIENAIPKNKDQRNIKELYEKKIGISFDKSINEKRL